MELKKTIEELINSQINNELYSSYLYLAASAFFKSSGYNGFANWMRKQSKEEESHAMKLFDYLIERGKVPKLMQIEKPSSNWKTVIEVFKSAYEHEKAVSEMINKIFEVSRKEQDYATEVYLHWFITEQVEEESTAFDLYQKVKLIGDSSHGLLVFDMELGNRAK